MGTAMSVEASRHGGELAWVVGSKATVETDMQGNEFH